VDIERIEAARVRFGEGPSWDHEHGLLWFADIGGEVVTVDERHEVRRSHVDHAVFAVIPITATRVVLVVADGVRAFDLETGAIGPLRASGGAAGTTLADAKTDSDGGLIVVSSDREMASPRGALLRFAEDGVTVLELAGGFALGNGPCWSPDRSRFYVSDSAARQIYVMDWGEGRPLSSRRLFADTRSLGGIPDGATVDADGNLWVAMFGAGVVACFAPDGVVRRLVEMPTTWCSSVMFGGRGLDRLYVTSLDPSIFAGSGGLAAELGTEPDEGAGHLFVVDGLEVVGVAEPRIVPGEVELSDS